MKALQEEIKVLSEKVGEAKSKGAEAPTDAVTEGGEKKAGRYLVAGRCA